MFKFMVYPEKCRAFEIDAANAEIAYRSVCSFYNPATRVVIINNETRETAIFTRDIDNAGNMVNITRVL